MQSLRGRPKEHYEATSSRSTYRAGNPRFTIVRRGRRGADAGRDLRLPRRMDFFGDCDGNRGDDRRSLFRLRSHREKISVQELSRRLVRRPYFITGRGTNLQRLRQDSLYACVQAGLTVLCPTDRPLGFSPLVLFVSCVQELTSFERRLFHAVTNSRSASHSFSIGTAISLPSSLFR